MKQGNKVKDLVEEALALNESLFLIDLSISENNKIQVIVDGDNGVPLSECIRISRNVEHNLDREIEDFSLEVTSPDISHPLKEKRTLAETNNDNIVLMWKAREPKPIGKGKVTVEKTATIAYTNIKEAKVKIVF
jgi:ribosome maturation factor RimP